MKKLLLLMVMVLIPAVVCAAPTVVINTNMGAITVELNDKKAPVSTANFLHYVDSGFYNGTIFHRVIPNFMIQGGGFSKNMVRKITAAPIKNEAANGLKNNRGTIAMARTSQVDSATSQFFINLVDNNFLNHRSNSPRGFGYAVFGRVVKGMDVVDKIAAVATGSKNGMRNVPYSPVIIKSVTRLEEKKH